MPLLLADIVERLASLTNEAKSLQMQRPAPSSWASRNTANFCGKTPAAYACAAARLPNSSTEESGPMRRERGPW